MNNELSMLMEKIDTLADSSCGVINVLNNLSETVNEINDEINELKDKIYNIIKEDEFPKIGELYYYISDSGNIEYSTWCNSSLDRRRLLLGRKIYKTKEEANNDLVQLNNISYSDEDIKPYLNEKSDITSSNVTISSSNEYGEYGDKDPRL